MVRRNWEGWGQQCPKYICATAEHTRASPTDTTDEKISSTGGCGTHTLLAWHEHEQALKEPGVTVNHLRKNGPNRKICMFPDQSGKKKKSREKSANRINENHQHTPCIHTDIGFLSHTVLYAIQAIIGHMGPISIYTKACLYHSSSVQGWDLKWV